MSHEMTPEDKEYYKDVAHYGNEYVLRTLFQAMDELESHLDYYVSGDRFLSLKRELHRYQKVVKIRHEEVVAAGKKAK